jgi:hypothetical protein
MAWRVLRVLLRLSAVGLVLMMGTVALVTWQKLSPAAVAELGPACPPDGKYYDPFCPGDAIPTFFWVIVSLALVLMVAMMFAWAFGGNSANSQAHAHAPSEAVSRLLTGLLRLLAVGLALAIGAIAMVAWQMFVPVAVTETGPPCPRDGKYYDPFCPGDAIPTLFWAIVLLALVLIAAMMFAWAFAGFLPTRNRNTTVSPIDGRGT